MIDTKALAEGLVSAYESRGVVSFVDAAGGAQ